MESKPKKINCQELLDSLADYLDEDAQLELCRSIEEHLTACHDCQVYVDTVKKTIVLYHSDSHVQAPVQVSDQFRAALQRAYEEGRSCD